MAGALRRQVLETVPAKGTGNGRRRGHIRPLRNHSAASGFIRHHHPNDQPVKQRARERSFTREKSLLRISFLNRIHTFSTQHFILIEERRLAHAHHASAALTDNAYHETKAEDGEGETSFNNNNNDSREESRETHPALPALPALPEPKYRRNRSISLGSSTLTSGTTEGATNSKSGRRSGRVRLLLGRVRSGYY